MATAKNKLPAKKPVAKKPVAKKPVAKKPVAKKPVAKKQTEAFDLLNKIVEIVDSTTFENLSEYAQGHHFLRLISEASALVGSKKFRSGEVELMLEDPVIEFDDVFSTDLFDVEIHVTNKRTKVKEIVYGDIISVNITNLLDLP